MKDKNTKEENLKNPPKFRDDNAPGSTPGVNSPDIAPPAFNPPVPNRAWTAMINGRDIEELSEEEKRDMYLGHDDIF